VKNRAQKKAKRASFNNPGSETKWGQTHIHGGHVVNEIQRGIYGQKRKTDTYTPPEKKGRQKPPSTEM